MMNRVCVAAFLVVALTLSRFAAASFHEWRISEVFSDSTGNVQFIEFNGPIDNGENLLAGHQLTSDSGGLLTFIADLPNDQTAGKFFLVATDDFALLPGAPTPDFTIPANFFNPDGDTIHYAGVDDFTFNTLPKDGVFSLSRDLTTGANSPTNFAGDIGSVNAGPVAAVPLPPAMAPGMIGLALIALARGRGLFKLSRASLRSSQS